MKTLSPVYGPHVVLRPITVADTDLIVTWRNKPAVQQNFIFQETFTREMHLQWLHAKVDTGEVVQYIIEDAQTALPVGSVYLRDISPIHNSAEFGIFIGEDSARGKGFGSEATRLFVDFAFETLDLHRISLRVLDGNTAASRAYEKAGFQHEGIFRDMVKLGGIYRDVIFMAILNQKHEEKHTNE